MAVDKNLFLHDLAVVAILKCEAPYVKEWLDYHLLAGVDHFYLYDNDSPDNQAEVVAPYVKAGLVDYFFLPGKAMQMVAYNDAVNRFKFSCRYMTFLDGDEFIYPKVNWEGAIIDVVDEILSHDPNAAGLAINWQLFGSNGEEKADYSRGVLERFTRREDKINKHVKTIANPRVINFFGNPHSAIYFEGCYAVNESGEVVNGPFNETATANKIIINHYHTKSREEYDLKSSRGYAPNILSENPYPQKKFEGHDKNDEFDDGILKYRDARAENFQLPDKSHADTRLFAALAENLSPTLLPNTPQDFYAGKVETFLTCRAVAAYLQTKLTDEAPAKFFEEASLKALLKAVKVGTSFADIRLVLSELPNLLTLPYPEVKKLREACLHIIPQMMQVMRYNNSWLYYVELDYIQRLLKSFRK